MTTFYYMLTAALVGIVTCFAIQESTPPKGIPKAAVAPLSIVTGAVIGALWPIVLLASLGWSVYKQFAVKRP